MNNNLLKAQDIFLDRVNQICNKFGLNNIMAQLYAVLYLSANPMSLNDLVERINISKGSASINIRTLERYGAVRKVWVKGSRRDYYEAETDIAKVIIERIRSVAQHRLSEIDGMITASNHALNPANLFAIKAQDKAEDEAVKLFEQRMDALKKLYLQADSLLNLFNLTLLNNEMPDKSGGADKGEVLVSRSNKF